MVGLQNSRSNANEQHLFTLDEELHRAVRERINGLGIGDIDALNVSVSAGVVTLEGTLREPGHARRVVEAAGAVPGVRSVDSRLSVVPDPTPGKIVPGMRVINERHRHVGVVAESYGSSFLLEYPSGARVYVPSYSVLGTMPGAVIVHPALEPEGDPR